MITTTVRLPKEIQTFGEAFNFYRINTKTRFRDLLKSQTYSIAYFCELTYNKVQPPSEEKLIKICNFMHLNKEQTNDLLFFSKYYNNNIRIKNPKEIPSLLYIINHWNNIDKPTIAKIKRLIRENNLNFQVNENEI